MTLSDLLTAYADGGGTLTGDALRRSVQEVWPLMLMETRNRVLSTEADSGPGRTVIECFSAMVEAASETGGSLRVEAASETGGSLRSETLGQWSRTYQESGRTREEALRLILRQYLGETGLLYRGWPA